MPKVLQVCATARRIPRKVKEQQQWRMSLPLSLSLSICIYNKLIAYDRILDLRLSPVFSHLHFIPLVQAGPLALFLYKVRFVPLAGNRSTWLFHPLNNKSMHQVVFHDF